MVREIYEVYAKVVDANGAYNTLSGYPKAFDSRNYSNDPAKAKKRAESEFSDTWGKMLKRDDRQLQLVLLMRAKTGEVLDINIDGTVPDDPGQVTPEE